MVYGPALASVGRERPLPCCFPIPSSFSRTPHLTYDDPHILSPRRTIHVWGRSEK